MKRRSYQLNLINLWFKRLLKFLLLLLLVQCFEKPYYSCDLYSNNKCQIKTSDAYLLSKPNQPVITFTDLSYYLYFHSKVTPGFRVTNFALNGKKENLKECWYRLSDPTGKLQPVDGHLEGFRIDDSGIWCFDYFGTFLLKFVRHNKIENQPADLAIFPLKLTIGLTTNQKQGPEIQRLIQFKLNNWQFKQAD